ncbi:MAG: hypothetical protein N3A59_03025 [Thermodesulfovibrionales bacterium]|nr:hypothetical protein [Thermodesulfovibrionales bacterium]
MSFKNLQIEISKGMPELLYLITSKNDYLLQESYLLLKESLNCSNSINFVLYDLDSDNIQTSIREIIATLNTPPFFDTRRIVMIKNLQQLNKKDTKELTNYIAFPADYTLLIMFFQGDYSKLLPIEHLKKIKIFTLQITAKDLPLWIDEKAKKAGLLLPKEVIDYIMMIVGDDLEMINSEIQKISLLGVKKVSLDDIKDLLFETIEYNAFQLIKAIENNDKEKIFKFLNNLDKNTDLPKLLGALNWYYRTNYEKAKSINKEKYMKIFELLYETDLAIKSSQSGALESFLFKMLQYS